MSKPLKILLWSILILLIGYISYYGLKVYLRPNFNNFYDPDSVVFRNEKIKKSGFLCGEFNAKNGLGAYTGYKRFITFHKWYLREIGDNKIEEGGSNFEQELEIYKLLSNNLSELNSTGLNKEIPRDKNNEFEILWGLICEEKKMNELVIYMNDKVEEPAKNIEKDYSNFHWDRSEVCQKNAVKEDYTTCMEKPDE